LVQHSWIWTLGCPWDGILKKGGNRVRILEAVYEGGVPKPLEDPGLGESQRVLLEILTERQETGSSAIEAWHGVYDGLSEGEIAEIEAIVLGRSHLPAGSPPAAARRSRPEP